MEQFLPFSNSLPNFSPSTSPSSSPSSASTSAPASKSWLSGVVRSHSLKVGGNSGLFCGGDIGGPIVVNNQFRGVLFEYVPKPIQVSFKTGDYKQQVVFVAELTDGFLATEYLERLASALDKEKWSLVQFLLSSSYGGYGTCTLQQMICEGRGSEMMPREADPNAPITACRLCKAMEGAEKLELEHGNPWISNRVEEVVRVVINFLKRGGPKGCDDPWN